MADTSQSVEILLRIMEDNKAQARQAEDQRVAITGFVVLIASAIQGGLTQTGFNKNSLPLTIMLIILGLFGGLASVKLHQRASLSYTTSNKILERLEELYPSTHIHKILESSTHEQIGKRKAVAFLHTRIRVYAIWLALHCLIIILGVIYTSVILFK